MYKATNIATPEEIFKACTEVQSFIEAHYESDNANACIDRATQAEAYMGLTSKMLADARYNYNRFLNTEFMGAVKEAVKQSMSPSTMNKYIDTLCKDYSYLVDWTERLNRSCTHCIELQRTLISKLKAEISQTNWR